MEEVNLRVINIFSGVLASGGVHGWYRRGAHTGVPG